MSLEELTSLAMEVLLESNKVIKRQAEERQVIYQKLVDYSLRNSDELDDVEFNEFIEEHLQETLDSDFFKLQKVAALNRLIVQLDQKEAKRDRLLEEIRAMEANLESRRELIKILKEYVEMEEASIYGLVENYNEAQEVLEKSKEKGEIFEILSANDPRIKALQTIQNHEQGISVIQLSFMLGTTQYNANKIINELIEMELITRKDQLIKIGTSSKAVENPLLNLTV